MPPTVVSELSPKLLVNANVPFPPTAFFTTWIDPVGGGAEQTGVVMVLESNVTAPSRANTRPFTVAPVVTVMDESARMLPWKTEYVPSVAELPTCQKTLQGWAPRMRTT